MKQIVTFTRKETLKLELEVLQPLTAATLEGLINQKSLGAPLASSVLQQETTYYQVVKAEPSCECQAAAGKSKRRTR